jgi:hypothetical protein
MFASKMFRRSGVTTTKRRKKVNLAFGCDEVDWVVDTPQPVKPIEPVRDA